MMSGLGRFRKTDAFAIVGLLVLLTWTPGYIAQGDDAKSIADGERFDIPERRVGDTIAYSVVISTDDGRERAIGPVQRITFKEAQPDEAPVAAAYVETRTTYTTSGGLGAIEFESLAFEDRHFYAENGSMVWRSVSALERDEKTNTTTYTEAGVRTVAEYDTMVRGFEGDVWFEPDAMSSLILRVSRDIWAEFTSPTRSDDQLIANRAATHGNNQLYGLLTTRAASHQVESAVNPGVTSYDWTVDDSGRIRPDLRIPNTQFRTTEGHALRGEAKWMWASPGSARPTGSHTQVRDADGTAYRIDIVPSELTSGSGPVVPWTHVADRMTFQSHAPLALPHRPGMDRLPLAELESDETPLFENASLRDVRDLLDAAAPASIKRQLAEGARIVEFVAQPGAPSREGTDPTIPPTPLLPVEPQTAVDDTLVRRSNWTLGLMTPDGTIGVARLWLEERPGPNFAAIVADACRDEEDPPRACGTTWPEPVDWQQPFITPGGIVSAAASDNASAGYLADYAPLADCDRGSWSPSPLGSDTCRRMLINTLGDGSNREWASASMRYHGQATWRSLHGNGPNTAYDLQDGKPLAMWHERAATNEDLAPQSTTGEPVTLRPAVLDVVGTTAAWSGLLLMLVTGTARFLAAIRAGLHLSLVATLFSRVSKADALLNERRADIIELLGSDPGLTAQEVSQRLGYSRTATLHHLETLMRTGQLLYVQNGQLRHYFHPDGTERERVRFAVARDDGYADLLHVIDETPGITLAELTRQLHRSKPRLSRMLARLERLGVLQRRREGRTLRVFPSGQAGAAAPAVS